ncbi:unnamed protein product, partial [Closterium sp. NIES-54]
MYGGDSARRIWQAIHQESCFQDYCIISPPSPFPSHFPHSQPPMCMSTLPWTWRGTRGTGVIQRSASGRPSTRRAASPSFPPHAASLPGVCQSGSHPERYTGYGGDSARRICQAIYQESCIQDGTRGVPTSHITTPFSASSALPSTRTASQVYVNLALNPERYTGYGGDSARRIWQAIYQESCFQDGTKDECTERRVLYRLISGLHQAISVHVAASQIWDSAAGQWGPNITIFHHRVAKFPERLANLYFTFLFVLRAATKAADFLSRASYDTGNPLEDHQTSALVQQVVRNERLQAACPLPFDEARMWRGDEGPQLKQTLQGHFRNI